MLTVYRGTIVFGIRLNDATYLFIHAFFSKGGL